MSTKAVYELPAVGSVKLSRIQEKYVDFIIKNQVSDENLWKLFISAFTTDADTADDGWRGEYWGKMMRGACLIYRVKPSDELYGVLEGAVTGMLEAQDSMGRFSAYSVDHEFNGWDIWARKYILTGMLHFYDICKSEALKKTILSAMERHVDYLIGKIGDDKLPITKTSDIWLGVNSCSILEPIVELYRRTNEKRYLEFAEYIISTGGIDDEKNLMDLALENKLMPFEYPETKAYETMSFFEGLLAYYEVTGNEKYLQAVLNFSEAVYNTDITIIGCAGCSHELFDDSKQNQTKYSEVVMQETCVTVTWMRLTLRLYMLTGDEKYYKRIEESALNALYGSINEFDLKMKELSSGQLVDGLPFDSYSPLYNNTRGRGIGGFKRYPDGRYYGCCACIGAAGVAVYPIASALNPNREPEDDILIEERLNNMIAFKFGPYVLARDEQKQAADFEAPITPVYEDGKLVYIPVVPLYGERVRLLIKTEEGNLLFTDYASCGKNWDKENCKITVWNNLK